jgi:hypothetical protein
MFLSFPNQKVWDKSVLLQSLAKLCHPSTLWRKQKMNNSNNKDNEQVASGSLFLKFNLTRQTIVAILGSISLFSSGFYAGFAYGQKSPKSLESVPQVLPKNPQPPAAPKM